jgi:hypothetical protein
MHSVSFVCLKFKANISYSELSVIYVSSSSLLLLIMIRVNANLQVFLITVSVQILYAPPALKTELWTAETLQNATATNAVFHFI